MLNQLKDEITIEALTLSEMVIVLEFIHTFKDEDLFTQDEGCKNEWILSHMKIVQDQARKLRHLIEDVTFEDEDELLDLLIFKSRLIIEKIVPHYRK
jgi:hypothetical protein